MDELFIFCHFYGVFLKIAQPLRCWILLYFSLFKARIAKNIYINEQEAWNPISLPAIN